MSKKLTSEEAISKARTVWGDRFVYPGKYTGYCDKTFEVVCPRHGKFTTSLDLHLGGVSGGCPECHKEYIISEQRKNTNDFITELVQKYVGQEINYENINYISAITPIELVCGRHGAFYATPHDLLNKDRVVACPTCSLERKAEEKVKKYADSFRDRLLSKHGGKIILLGSYNGAREKTRFMCMDCGNVFEDTPNKQLSPNRGGCGECNKRASIDNQRLTLEEIQLRSEEVFGPGKFTYKNYTISSENVEITCTSCRNTFHRLLSNHFKSNGCPFCGEKYHLEKTISEFLNRNSLLFLREMSFDWLINSNKNKLRLDFYLPEYRVGIECQGIQHFQPIDIFGGAERFVNTTKNDQTKFDLCSKNGIKLLYFSDLGIQYPYQVFEDLDLLYNEIINTII